MCIRDRTLLRLNDDAEQAEHARVRKEFDLRLVRLLRDPKDDAAREALSSLSTAVELARARLQERTVRATRAGLVSDIRARVGQHVAPGELLLNLIEEQAPFVLVAILPGQYRPALHPGMTLRLELVGYRYAYLDVPISSVQDEVIGPSEIQRYLGREQADAVSLQGPAVLVNAVLPRRNFDFDGMELGFYHGMPARAEVAVRSERALFTVFPALRTLARRAR